MQEIDTIQAADELLVDLSHGDSPEPAVAEIFLRYEPTIRSISSNYFVPGADADDVCQEGRIGLFKAMVNYDPSRNDKFRPFAVMCIRQQILNAVRSAARKKHMPLNSYVSLDEPVYEREEDGSLAAAQGESNPEVIFIDRESREGIDHIINSSLTPAEREVLSFYIKGVTYKDIANATGKNVKAVDNTIQSIKRKLKPKIS